MLGNDKAVTQPTIYMNEDFNITFQGLAELRKKLTQFNEKLPEKIALISLRNAGNILLKQIRSATPSKTGRLRRAITLKKSKLDTPKRNDKVGVYIRINPGKKKNGKDGKVAMGRDDQKGAWYGGFVEKGYTAGGRRVGRADYVKHKYGKKSAQRQRKIYLKLRFQKKKIFRVGGRWIQGRHFIKNSYEANSSAIGRQIVANIEIAGAQFVKSIGG